MSGNFGGWFATTTPDTERDTYPLNDDKPHELGMSCHCRPTSEQDPDGYLRWMHNSFDGREDFEEGRRLPS